MKRIIIMLLCAAMVLSLAACGGKSYNAKKLSKSSEDLTAQYNAEAEGTSIAVTDLDCSVASTDFALRLFKACAAEDGNSNMLLSPVSVLYALAMTANGANGETGEQMEEVLGMSTDEMNSWLGQYITNLPENEKYKLSIADSVWFTNDDRLTVNEDFLKTAADYYRADVYKSSFNDQTVKDINQWVANETDGMVTDILDSISDDAVMYLVNALAFDAEWQTYFESYNVLDNIFTTEDGTEQEAEIMYSTEYEYLDDGNATGFIKNYADGKYAFAALLPNEGTTVAEYLNTLDGEKLHELLSNPEDATVDAGLPKFTSEYSTEMSDVLASMGITDAFNSDNADFSGLGTSTAGNIFINRVLHKTYIAVDEQGTKAGAATVVEMVDGCTFNEDIKEVYLNRPFVYMIIDTESCLPLFIGTVMDMG